MFQAQIVMARKPRKSNQAVSPCEEPLTAAPCAVESFRSIKGDLIASTDDYQFCVERYPTKVKSSENYNRYSVLSNAPDLEKKQGVTVESLGVSKTGQSFYVYRLTIPAHKKLQNDPSVKEVFYDDFTRIFEI